MSKKDEKYESPKDEIPGMTSYLYEQHRFRLPHEYTNYWKWEENANEIRERLGLQGDQYDVTYVLEILEKLKHDYDQDIGIAQTKLGDLQEEHHKLTASFIDLRKENTDQTKKISKLEQKYWDECDKVRLLTLALQKHGSHAADCDWIVMIQSGRLHGTEEEQCNCDWLQTKEKLSNLPDK